MTLRKITPEVKITGNQLIEWASRLVETCVKDEGASGGGNFSIGLDHLSPLGKQNILAFEAKLLKKINEIGIMTGGEGGADQGK